jgi:hypothetical protein
MKVWLTLGLPLGNLGTKGHLAISSTYRHVIYDREEVGGLLPNLSYVNVMSPRTP